MPGSRRSPRRSTNPCPTKSTHRNREEPNPMDASALLDRAARKALGRFRKTLARAASEPGEEAVHDLRVAIRRLQTYLSVEADLANAPDAALPLLAPLKRLMRPLGRLRDLQVRLIRISALVPEGDDVSYAYALAVRSESERRMREVKTLLSKTGQDLAEKGEGKIPGLDMKPGDLRRKALKLLAVRESAVRALRVKASDERDTEALHRMRLAFKKYRYAAEVLAPIFPAATDQTMSRLHDFQTLLGDLHDLDVMLADARAFASVVLLHYGQFDLLDATANARRTEFATITKAIRSDADLTARVFGVEFR